MKSRVEALADDIRDEERRGELRPVRAVIDPRQAIGQIQREILEEMAGALGRAERRVHEAIGRLATLEPGSEAWEAQRQEALRQRRDLSIHREALRFPADPRFYEEFPIPGPRPPVRGSAR